MLLMLDFNETIDPFAVVNCVHYFGNMLRREDGHVFGGVLVYEVEWKEGGVGSKKGH